MRTSSFAASGSSLFLLAACLAIADTAPDWAILQTQGKAAKTKGDYGKAEKNFRAAIHAAEQYGDRDIRLENSLTELASVLQAEAKYEQVEPLLLRALSIRRANFAENSLEVAFAKNNLAGSYQQLGRYQQAEPLQREALEVAQHVLPPGDQRLIPFLTHYGNLERMLKNFSSSEKVLTQALSIATESKQDALGQATVLRYLGSTYASAQQFSKAEESYRRALDLMVSALGEGHPETITILSNLGDVLAANESFSSALPTLLQAVETCRKNAALDTHPCLVASNNLALVERAMGNTSQAEKRSLVTIAILEKAGLQTPPLATAWSNLAQTYVAEQRFKEAEKAVYRARDIWEAISGSHSIEYASTISNLASVYEGQGKYGKAEALARQALDTDTQILGQGHVRISNDLNRLAAVLFKQKRLAESEAMFRRALEIRSQQGAITSALGTPILNLAAVVQAEHRNEEAAGLYRRGLAILTQAGRRYTPEMEAALDRYASLMREMKEFADAERASTEALGIRVKRAVQTKSFH